ncbi:Flp pilus assembly protein TadB [Streptomyces sp. LBL]|uniref:type II secretion system F family protein n=1 Tax=Streptomyces sp. LBL TaxID=2940562 RepID=UPI002474E968|nr:type II secretion system F family protein [Streptomyces sp. LBL]MDH6624317.1 Flp pilus assembly protein TadB [Streptomyces sp. LBL]
MSAEVVHRLGVVMGAALALECLLRWAGALRRERRMRRRLTAMLPVAQETSVGSRFDVREFARRWLPATGMACAAWLLVGGVVGAVAGLVVGAGLWWWRRRQVSGTVAGAGTRLVVAGTGPDADIRAAARQLPLAADLLAACIAAGAGPVIAAQAVGEALGGPVGEVLGRGAAEVRLGGEPGEAWRRLAGMPGAGALARLLERADVSGLPAAAPVARLAADARADWTRTATARARRAGVLVTAPVGLCFLPAFITVGVLPVVIGLAGGALGGGGE